MTAQNDVLLFNVRIDDKACNYVRERIRGSEYDISQHNRVGEKHQAVTLRKSSNLPEFYSCSFEGYQERLSAYLYKMILQKCDIYNLTQWIVYENTEAVF